MEEDLYNLGTKRRKSSEIGRFYDELEKISKDKANFISFKETYKNSIEDYKLSKDKLKNLEYKLKGSKAFWTWDLKGEVKRMPN